MHDIIDLEDRGLPGGFVASSEFIEAAEAQANSLGLSPKGVYVPHPIQDRSDEEMVELAKNASEQITALICES
ncbi:MAG: hypothetical protein CMQ02_04865 [Gammaproteobacteria bacterium]|nr:hypothetical protein [Gammaproteobacteria bacterium]